MVFKLWQWSPNRSNEDKILNNCPDAALVELLQIYGQIDVWQSLKTKDLDYFDVEVKFEGHSKGKNRLFN